MPININGEDYDSYEEQVLKNKKNIENIQEEISGLVISTTKVKTITSGSFTTSGKILQVVVVTDEGVVTAYIGDDVYVEGLTSSETATVSVTITSTSVEITSGSPTVVIYYDDVTQ